MCLEIVARANGKWKVRLWAVGQYGYVRRGTATRMVRDHVPRSNFQGPRSKVLSLLCCPRTMESVGIIFNRYVPRMRRSFRLFYSSSSSSHLYLPIQGILSKRYSTHPPSTLRGSENFSPVGSCPPSPNRWSPFSINRLRLPCALAAEEEHAIPRDPFLPSRDPSAGARKGRRREEEKNGRIEGGVEQIDKVR